MRLQSLDARQGKQRLIEREYGKRIFEGGELDTGIAERFLERMRSARDTMQFIGLREEGVAGEMTLPCQGADEFDRHIRHDARQYRSPARAGAGCPGERSVSTASTSVSTMGMRGKAARRIGSRHSAATAGAVDGRADVLPADMCLQQPETFVALGVRR